MQHFSEPSILLKRWRLWYISQSIVVVVFLAQCVRKYVAQKNFTISFKNESMSKQQTNTKLLFVCVVLLS